MADAGDHYRATGDDYPSGVYRVVGTLDDVTLLRVADADGRREHTGEIRRVPPSVLAEAFEPAEDPDTGFSPVRAVRNALQGLYWQFRRFL
ncbi:hypothetical protein [Halostella salina]|uniref:hypothetical protein n=1 Tax=Halostella salina TaxID=1547897 RepID=UPI000EF79143|nr:hypothetical protein [Halostella salina]